MSEIRTVYIAEADTDVDSYGLKITKMQEKVRVEVVHTHYNGKAETTAEGIVLPMETFKDLMDTIWKGL